MAEAPQDQTEPSQSNTPLHANFFWLVFLVILSGTGIFLLVQNIGHQLLGASLLGMALFFFWSMEEDRSAPGWWLSLFQRLAAVPVVFLVVSAAICSISAAWLGLYIEQHFVPLGKNLAVLLWLSGGLILFLMHCRLSWDGLRQWVRQYSSELIVVGIMTLIAAILRFSHLENIPNMINGDEGWTGMVALGKFPLAPFIYTNPFSFAEGFGRPYLDTFAAAINIFGQNKFGLRFIPALGGTLAIPAIYLFTRRLFNSRHATIAALLLTFSHTHIHFSRTSAIGYHQSSWLAPLELYCFLRGLEDRNRNWIVLGGLLLGIHFNVYFSAQVLIPLTVVFLVMAGIIRPPRVGDGDQPFFHPPLPIRENLRNLPWFVGSILIMAFPALIWIANHPDDFSARWAKEGSIQSGWLAGQTVSTGTSTVMVLVERFAHVFQAIFVLPVQDFYWAPAPVLDLVTAILFILGVFLALRRTRDPKILLLNGWFWSGVVAIAFFAIPPAADSYRLFMVLPAMCVMAALGWAHITSLAERLAHIERRTVVVWSIALVLLVAALNLKIYFIDFGRSCVYGGQSLSTRRASLLGDYLRAQPGFDHVFLLNDDFAYGIFPSLDYLSGSIPVTNIGAPFVPPMARGSVLFIIPPSRANEYSAVTQSAPDGRLTRITDCGALMFMAYQAYTPQ